MIRLLALGGLEVRHDSENDAGLVFGQGKRAALLVYLAVARPRGAHSRDTLVSLFWPESDDRHARDALNQLLRRVRRAVGDDVFLDTPRNVIAVDPSVVWCDAAELEAAVDRGDHTRALELYRGDFLEGAHLPGAPDFEDWVASCRASLREQAATAGTRLAEAHEKRGELPAAIEALGRALQLGPYDEGRVRSLMRLHMAGGDHGRAAEAFERYAERLARELGAKPAPETVALLQSTRARVVVAPEPPVVTVDRARPPEVSAARRTRSARPPWVIGVAAGAATVAAVLFARSPATEAPALEKERVLVDHFENQTGDPTLDRLGRLATDHITAGLTFTTFADVVTTGSSLLSRNGEPVPPDADPVEVAVRRGAGTLVTGTYALVGDSVRFDAQLVDVATETVIAPAASAVGSPLEATATLEELRDHVMAALGAHVDPRLERWSRYSSRPPTLEVYRKFAEGIEAHTTLDRPGGVSVSASIALPLFLEAFEADPTFTMAAIWGSWAAQNAGNRVVRDSLSDLLLARRESMVGLDRLMVDGMAATTPLGRLEAWRRVVEIAPGSSYLKHAADMADRAGHVREALRYREAADPASGWLYGWFPFFNAYGAGLARVGRCDEIPEIAELARRSLPTLTAERIRDRLELKAYSCLADLPRLTEVARRYLAREAIEYRDGFLRSFPLAGAAVQLIALAPDGTDVAPFLELVEEGIGANLGDGDPRVTSQLARFLAASGRWDEVPQLFADAGLPVDPLMEGVLHIRAGRLDHAERIIDEFGRQDLPYLGFHAEAVLASWMGDMDRAMRAAVELKKLQPGWVGWVDRWEFQRLWKHQPYVALVTPPPARLQDR